MYNDGYKEDQSPDQGRDEREAAKGTVEESIETGGQEHDGGTEGNGRIPEVT
ncbi:MAG: hypothetical protein ABR985_18355 [Methanotrichaceae archaeon]